MDCIAESAVGFHNVIASSGAAFTETQVRLLARYSKNIVVNFDPDTAGAAATDRSLAMLVEEEFDIKILRLEAGFEPDLFIRRNGKEAYAKALLGATKYFEYLIHRAIAMFSVKTPEGKQKAVNFLLPYVHRVPSRIVRDSLANDIAQKLGIDSSVMRQEFKSAATRRSTTTVRAAVDAQVTSSEKVLVRAVSSTMFNEAELRVAAIDALASENLHVGLSTESPLQTLLENAHAISDQSQLPLNDADRDLLARIVMREDDPLTAE